MSGYDFSGFSTNPPKGMEVLCANADYLWLARLRTGAAVVYREDFLVTKEGEKFMLYRNGIYDKKELPEKWMTEQNAILSSNHLLPILRVLGYKVK